MAEQVKDYTKDPRFPIYMLKAENHWREYRPKRFRALRKEGKLNSTLSELVTSALMQMDQMKEAGVHQDVIREVVLPQYIYLPEE